MQSNFLSMILRMKYINRWGLMRNSRAENLSEHSLDVAIITHCLCVIAKVRLAKEIDPQRGAMLAMFHDASEIITGDLPTPIKYLNNEINKAYKQVELEANNTLLKKLPPDMQSEYAPYFQYQDEDKYLLKLVKAADKLSALIKCIEEERSGNTEFTSAKKATQKSLDEMDLEEINIFKAEFLDGFSKTLDEQI